MFNIGLKKTDSVFVKAYFFLFFFLFFGFLARSYSVGLKEDSGEKTAYYENCQSQDIYKLDSLYRRGLIPKESPSKGPANHQTETEASGSCVAPCAPQTLRESILKDDNQVLSDNSLAEVISNVQKRSGQMSRKKKKNPEQENFKKKLQQRVIGQIQTKLARTKALRLCVMGKENQLFQRGATPETVEKFDCPKRKKALADSINSRWSDMRINLALTSINADQIVTGKPYLSHPLSHEVSDFGSISRLNREEQKQVKQKWAEHLSQTPLSNISSEKFYSHFMEGNGKFLGKSLNSSDIKHLKQTTESLRAESRDRYRKIIEDMPLLAYLKTGDPDNKKDMQQAFSQVEKNLNQLLEKVQEEDVDKALLLSFEPLVEELIAESEGGLCLIAERAKKEAQRDQDQKSVKLFAGVILSILPCFMGGGVGTALCLGAGVGVGALSYTKAQSALDESLGKALTGRDFEKISDLLQKDQALFWERALLPTAIRSTVLGTVKLGQKVLSKTPRRGTKEELKTIDRPADKLLAMKKQKQLALKYKGLIEKSPHEEQNVILRFINQWEQKGVSSKNISYRVNSALRQCATP